MLAHESPQSAPVRCTLHLWRLPIAVHSGAWRRCRASSAPRGRGSGARGMTPPADEDVTLGRGLRPGDHHYRAFADFPGRPRERWSMDFVHDALADGRPFRILTVVDQWSRSSPVLEVASRMSGY